jgi:The GLUG motif
LSRGTVSQSHSTGEVSGSEAIGGLIGQNGTAGRAPHPGRIDRSYSLATVRGETLVGGLVGHNVWSTVSRCYSAGTASGTEWVGGLVGGGGGPLSDVAASFWDIEASGLTVSSGGLGKTTAQMRTAGTFLEAGWDFVGEAENGTEDIWWIDEGRDYPRLWWEVLGDGPAESVSEGGEL